MKLVTGGNLSDMLGRSPISAADIVRIVAASARAISRCHQQGVVHRDLQPSNIRIDTEGNPHILDNNPVQRPYEPHRDGTFECNACVFEPLDTSLNEHRLAFTRVSGNRRAPYRFSIRRFVPPCLCANTSTVRSSLVAKSGWLRPTSSLHAPASVATGVL